jgi:phage-related holin
MLTIVIGLAAADIVTGWIKAHVKEDYSSKVMRKGGLNKLCEIVVMATACGLEIGIKYLGQYYDSPNLAKFAGTAAAFGIFFYIMVMEVISVLENYAEANPEAAGWITVFLKKLRNFTEKEDKKNE